MNLYKKLQPQIKEIIRGVENFNNCYTAEDYLQEAYLACLQAEKAYKKMKNGNRMKMQFSVFAHWYVKKRLYHMADTGEVAYEIYTQEGEYLKTLYNGEFRKTKKEYEKEGCYFKSVRITEGLHRDWDGKEMEMHIAGPNETYEEEEKI